MRINLNSRSPKMVFILLLAIPPLCASADLEDTAVEYVSDGNDTAAKYFKANPDQAVKAMLLDDFKPIKLERVEGKAYLLFEDRMSGVKIYRYTGIIGFSQWSFPDGIYWAKPQVGWSFSLDGIIAPNGSLSNDGGSTLDWEEVEQ